MAARPQTLRTTEARPARGRVLRGLRHGAHVPDGHDDTTAFGYLLPELAQSWPDAHLPDDDPRAMTAALTRLGRAMVEGDLDPDRPLEQPGSSTIPPVYTYWGQFIDHDMTANTDRESSVGTIDSDEVVPLDPMHVALELRNLRDPRIDLDSVYGGGPDENPEMYDGIRLAVGSIALQADDGSEIPGKPVAPPGDLLHDLPRDEDGTALIGDDRDDENLIVAQLHTAMLRFHNAVVDWVREHEEYRSEEEVFERARELVRWHHGWLVVNDFLRTVTLPGTVDRVLLGDEHVLDLVGREVFMPLEYSVAAYRFGHSMVRAAYDFNRNFGNDPDALSPATLQLLFTFTGKAQPPFDGATKVLPFNWVIDWERFVDRASPEHERFTRKIDTHVAPPLLELPDMDSQRLAQLPVRNLLRGYLLSIPTGQAVAEALGCTPLSADELQQDSPKAVRDALRDGGFLERTPLWYYVLKEAEVRAQGNSLGELGSRIVCETIIGQMRADETSYLRAPKSEYPQGWTPRDGVRWQGRPLLSIGDLLRFAGVLA